MYLPSMSPRRSLPKLPDLLSRKLYKTGQTRGATNREIYQNRVSRNSTVLIPWELWDECRTPYGDDPYENGFIVLVDPAWYFTADDPNAELNLAGVSLGYNALLFYNRRALWESYGPYSGHTLPANLEFTAPTSRLAPIGGTVLARIHGTTSEDGKRISIGYDSRSLRGAGIRVFEYASTEYLRLTRLQLEAQFWLSNGSIAAVVEAGMDEKQALNRKTHQLEAAQQEELLNFELLQDHRIVDAESRLICPLCLELISGDSFFVRVSQAQGRQTWDLTSTEVSLFHINELRVGTRQHRPYNLGWGHHFCNVVANDAGIDPPLDWMHEVLERNI